MVQSSQFKFESIFFAASFHAPVIYAVKLMEGMYRPIEVPYRAMKMAPTTMAAQLTTAALAFALPLAFSVESVTANMDSTKAAMPRPKITTPAEKRVCLSIVLLCF